MKVQISIVILTLVLIVSTNTVAYTTTIGIEENDEVNMKYILSYDGEIQQENDDFTTVVSSSGLIEGFYLGLLGMFEGQQKNIVVQPDQGYPPGHELGGKILYFDVTINKIVTNVRGNNYIAPVKTETSVYDFYKNEITVQEDSVFQNLISSPVVMVFSITGLVLIIYLKTSGSKVVENVVPKKITGKMSAQERLKKRREEVDKKLHNK